MSCIELKQKISADPYAVTEDDLAECEDCRVLLEDDHGDSPLADQIIARYRCTGQRQAAVAHCAE